MPVHRSKRFQRPAQARGWLRSGDATARHILWHEGNQRERAGRQHRHLRIAREEVTATVSEALAGARERSGDMAQTAVAGLCRRPSKLFLLRRENSFDL